MKPTSIISLIVAVCLIVAGLITCFVAQNIASKNGEFIFAENRGDDFVNTVELEQDISKIELIVEDAEINIWGNSDKSYIEFVNFSENYYSLSVSNTILSFDEIPDILSMVKFWESGFSFKGMRYLLNFSSINEDAKKKINIYLKDDHALKIFDITAESCTLNIENININCDYKLCVNNATIKTNSINTGGTFNINSAQKENPADKIIFKASYSIIKNLSITTENLQTDMDQIRLTGDANINCETGDIKIRFIDDPTNLNLDLKTSGSLCVSESEYINNYTYAGNAENPGLIKIISTNATIDIAKTTTNISNTQNNQ